MATATQTPASAAAKAGQRRRDQDQHRADEPVDANQAWFAARGWQPFDFQRQVWSAMAQGRSGLLHATTGAGKNLRRLAGCAGLGPARRTQPRWRA